MIQYFPIVTGSLTVLGNISVSGSITTSGSITISGSITSASFATSASNATNAISASYANNLTVAGTLTAQTIVVQTITSSVIYSSGSNVFGNNIANTQVMTGSVLVSGSGFIGIGTNSPIYSTTLFSAYGSGSDVDIDIKNNTSAGTANLYLRSQTDGSGEIRFTRNSDNSIQGRIQYSQANGSMAFRTGGNDNKLFISSSNDVGISTATPKGRLDVYRAAGQSGTAAIVLSNGESSPARNWSLNTEVVDAGDFAICVSTTTGGTPSPTGANSKLRILSGGTILVGSRNSLQQSYFGYSSAYKTLIIGSTGTDYNVDATTLCFGVDVSGNANGSFSGNGTEYMFRNAGSFKSPNSANNNYNTLLSWNSSGVVTVTTSDYRAKEDLKSFEALPMVQAMKLYDFRWIELQERMHGVLAHELQDIVPYAVIGEKDGGSMQGVDYSKLVPVLAKAIQELNTKFEEYKATHP